MLSYFERCDIIVFNGIRAGKNFLQEINFMNKRPEITEETKSNLRKAFWRLYENKPIEKISIKEITELSGYNRGTFYLYYKDIYDILEQSEAEILDKISCLLRDNLKAIIDQDLNGLIKSVLELVNPYSSYATILLGNNGDPSFTAKLKEILKPLLILCFNEYGDNYTDYQKKLIEEFWLSGILGLVQKWISDPQISIEELISFVVPAIYPNRKNLR